ncbi:MAG TPA: hypothetical protein VLS94_08300, partial [Fusibacter sp.]|nr:hypothetical protein [Fusibacter sp.]
MSKRIYTIFCIVLTFVILIGCSSETVPPDPDLIEFLPTINERYVGDSGYYHVVETIERESDADLETAILSGEVKDNETTITKADFDFIITLSVVEDKLEQTYTGSRLNESNFDKIVLLKKPLEIGNTWSFNAKDIAGNKWKVTGEITSVDETGERIGVKHSIKNGYYEERVMQKGRGVTDFVRLIIFKNESTVTGYHTENASVATTEKAEDTLKIPVAYYNLILGFEQAWPSYVKNDNDDLLKFISLESPALEKIKAVTRDANTA